MTGTNFQACNLDCKWFNLVKVQCTAFTSQYCVFKGKAACAGDKKGELHSIVSSLLAGFMSDELWDLPTSNISGAHDQDITETSTFHVVDNSASSRHRDMVSFQTLNSNIQQICLLVEGIGKFAAALEADFEPFLITVINPLMERLGDPNAAISQTAYRTLCQVSKSCGCSSLSKLIEDNVDYLVNAVSLNLRHLHTAPQALQVLQVMLRYSDKEVLPLLQDTLSEVFGLTDSCPQDLLQSLFLVLNGFVCTIRRWNFQVHISGKHQFNKTILGKTQEKDSQGLYQFFMDYWKTKQTAMGDDNDVEFVNDNDETHDNEPTDELLDQKPDVPLHVNNAVQVLEKCVHFLPSTSPTMRLLVLDTVQNGVKSLSTVSDQLLPILHKLWPPLVKRFSDSEQVVTIKAVQVLCTMVEESEDFMRRRVIKEALPGFLSYLDRQCAVSIRTGPMYLHTQAYKLQLMLLKAVGDLCLNLKIEDAECHNVAQTCAHYLSCQQPKPLQEAAVKTFNQLIQLEPDSMWLTLSDLYCPVQPVAPDPVFHQVQLAGLHSERNLYSQNVDLLLKSLQNA